MILNQLNMVLNLCYEVVNGWETAQGSRGKINNQKNFKELNKRAISNNIHTAKVRKIITQGQTNLRATMDILVKQKVGKKVMPIMLPE